MDDYETFDDESLDETSTELPAVVQVEAARASFLEAIKTNILEIDQQNEKTLAILERLITAKVHEVLETYSTRTKR